MNNTARRASIGLGIFMAVVLVAGAILPIFSQNTGTTAPNVVPTQAPIPTFPPPPADYATTVSFDDLYLHPTGIFAIARPAGWEATEPNRGPAIAQVNLVNTDVAGVVDSYVEQAFTGFTTENLSDHFTEAAINQSWARFQRWEETNRQLVDDQLVIDFNITLNQQTYAARQVAWTDGTWIYVVRVLLPSNAIDFLRYILDGMVESLTPLTQFQGTPLDWNVYYDPSAGYIIRYPGTWSISAGAAGLPISIVSADGVLLRAELRAGAAAVDEDSASAFVLNERVNATIMSVEAVERGLASGLSVAYQTRTVDGEAQSGVMVLLNGDNGVYVADLRYPQGGIDFNTVEIPSAVEAVDPEAEATQAVELPGLLAAPEAASDNPLFVNLALVLQTFQVIDPLPLGLEAPPVVLTPEPVIEVTSEATAEVTPEATAETTPEAELTPEATAETE